MVLVSTIVRDRIFESESDIDKFVTYQRRNIPRYQNKSLSQLVAERKFPEAHEVEEQFSAFEKQNNVSVVTLEHVRGICSRGAATIQALPPETRFWMQITVASRNSLYECAQKIIQTSPFGRKQIAYQSFFFKFKATYEVVKSLKADERIFTENASFSLDRTEQLLARLAAKILNYRIIELELDEDSETQKTDPSLIIYNYVQRHKEYEILEALTEDSVMIDALVDFMTLLNTHEAVADFAQARNLKLKLFILDVVTQKMFEGIDPFDLARIVAGLIMVIEQMDPDLVDYSLGMTGELTKVLTDYDLYSSGNVSTHLQSYLNQLNPAQIDDLAKTLLFVLTKITASYPRSYDVLEEVRVLSKFEKLGVTIDEISNQFSEGVQRLKVRGIQLLNTFVEMLENLEEKFRNYHEEKKRAEESEVFEEIEEASLTVNKEPEFENMANQIRFIETDQVDYKGERDTPIRLYREIHLALGGDENESFIRSLKHCFRFLFDEKLLSYSLLLDEKPYHSTFHFPEFQAKIGSGKETFYTIGLTKVTGRENFHKLYDISGNDLYLDPYILKLKGYEDLSQVNEIKNRKVTVEDKTFEIHAVPISKAHHYEIFKVMLALLHLLPSNEEGFYASDAQTCLQYLKNRLEDLEPA
ncbi:hypothetical protein WDW89_09980 [Deltaproteobacteria bacterium TL4]